MQKMSTENYKRFIFAHIFLIDWLFDRLTDWDLPGHHSQSKWRPPPRLVVAATAATAEAAAATVATAATAATAAGVSKN